MKSVWIMVLALFFSATSMASELMISGEYVRATPPHTKNTAAFFTIMNHGKNAVKLISASSNIAERVELHVHQHDNGVMKMRQVDSITIASHGHVDLQPGGYHVMFLGLKKSLKEGQTVTMTLSFDNGETIKLNAPVQTIKMSGKKTHHH